MWKSIGNLFLWLFGGIVLFLLATDFLPGAEERRYVDRDIW